MSGAVTLACRGHSLGKADEILTGETDGLIDD